VTDDLPIVDVGGDELAASIERLAPDTPVIMLTGFGDLMEAKGEQPAGVDAVIGSRSRSMRWPGPSARSARNIDSSGRLGDNDGRHADRDR
jgi:hypothetical protein